MRWIWRSFWRAFWDVTIEKAEQLQKKQQQENQMLVLALQESMKRYGLDKQTGKES